MAINKYHLSKGSVDTFAATFIQCGSASLSLGFSVVGVETVTATVTFATAFPTGTTPRVVYSAKDILAITHAVTAVSNTDFTISASDNVGTDYTTAQTLDIDYIAMIP